MQRRMITRLAVAGLAIGLLGACGDDDDADTAADDTTTTEGTLAPPFQDGTYFGYIVAIEEGEPPGISFDVARILEGEDAANSTAEGCGAEDIGFCIDNDDDTVRVVPLADDVEVLDITYGGDVCCDPHPSTLEELLADDTSVQPPPVNVTIEGSEITKIEEMYFP